MYAHTDVFLSSFRSQPHLYQELKSTLGDGILDSCDPTGIRTFHADTVSGFLLPLQCCASERGKGQLVHNPTFFLIFLCALDGLTLNRPSDLLLSK